MTKYSVCRREEKTTASDTREDVRYFLHFVFCLAEHSQIKVNREKDAF